MGVRVSDPSVEVTATDYHTAGEPFRIVTAGVPEIPGTTVRDRRGHASQAEDVDAIRHLLCQEPRGHADMYGCFLVPPDDDGADLGVLFWHTDGYSIACGHGTIALGTWLVETGRVKAPPDGTTDVVIDVPSGRVTARVACRDGRVEGVTFRNVPSYVLARGLTVRTSRGEVQADISFGGAIYASMAASSVGLAVTPAHYHELIAVGREVKHALDGTDAAHHPSDPRLSGIYGAILYDDLGRTEAGPHQRNVTIFADGEVDRSPCGSGTCARVALLADEGRLADGQTLTHDSIIGTRFLARVAGHASAEGRDAVVPEVDGNAYRTGEHVFVLDDRDPVGTGFVLR
jgi:proline racemase